MFEPKYSAQQGLKGLNRYQGDLVGPRVGDLMGSKVDTFDRAVVCPRPKVRILSLSATAASLVPSSLDATPYQSGVPSLTDVSFTQFAPESVDVQILPSFTPATSLAPSPLDATLHRLGCVRPIVLSTQFAPESADVQI